MVREAQRAGLNFDEKKLKHLNCVDDSESEEEGKKRSSVPIPQIEIDPASPDPSRQRSMSAFNVPLSQNNTQESKEKEADTPTPSTPSSPGTKRSRFHHALHMAATKGKIHDVLQFNNGVSKLSVISWNIMEYLPFRRMDLQEDGTWESITWPLPKGEVRDMPDDAMIHSSVIRRMEADENYRPGNLIVGGGGRGVRKAPKELGIGKWVVVKEPGCPLGEVVVRAEKPERKKTNESGSGLGMGAGGPQGLFLGGR